LAKPICGTLGSLPRIQIAISKTVPRSGEKSNGQRIPRKAMEIAGTGEAKVEFDVPKSTTATAVSVAAFIGDDFSSNLQHTADQSSGRLIWTLSAV
jgi:hypothetical protein